MYKNSFVHYLTKILVDVMFFGGIACCAAAPFVVPLLMNRFGYGERVMLPFTIILTIAGLCSLYILWQLKRIFKTLLGGNPFIFANVSCLRKCSVASFLLALTFTADLILWFTFGGMIMVVVFSLLGLFCLTLKDVFKQAITYKEENDWTV